VEQKIITNLWFDSDAEEAATHYTSVFPNSRIVTTTPYPENAPGPTGSAMTVEWEIDGQRFVGINGGPEFTFNEAISLQILCEDQAEVDYYWEKLSEGGSEGPCGWLKDRFGLSWQVIPRALPGLFSGDDPERARRAMEAMLEMKKIDLAALEAAAGGVPA
jgi:predicted 3-demethylubiquinone-9 3-methyltransferase (glyoxalase superfamily)